MRDLAELRRTHIGRYLFELEKAYSDITVPFIQNKGFSEFTRGQLQVLGLLHLNKPTPMKELIEKSDLSKQAVSRMVGVCEKNKFVKRVTSETDARAWDIIFTDKGKKLMRTAGDAILFAEKAFEDQLGKRTFNELKSLLAKAATELVHIEVD